MPIKVSTFPTCELHDSRSLSDETVAHYVRMVTGFDQRRCCPGFRGAYGAEYHEWITIHQGRHQVTLHRAEIKALIELYEYAANEPEPPVVKPVAKTG